MGRATQGVKLINLEKRNDEIASVCKVISEKDEEVASAGGEESELVVRPTEENMPELPYDKDDDSYDGDADADSTGIDGDDDSEEQNE